MGKNILFICTGNTCRSPIAEGLMRRLALDAGLELSIQSAGVAAMVGGPISAHSKKVLEDKGVQTDFASQAVNAELVAKADLILTMTLRHKQQVLSRFPEVADKIYALKEYARSEDEAGQDRELVEMLLEQSLAGTLRAPDKTRSAIFADREEDCDISDPFGGSLRDYRMCAEEIEDHLKLIIKRLQNE